MYREYLQRFLRERNIRTVVDFGCGDWQFSKMIDWSGLQYLGIDVVPSVIRENRRNHGSANISFIIADTDDASLPPADLLLLKDVLQHWPTRMIQSFLKTLGGFRYALMTNCIDTATNTDCPLGGYRGIDLRSAPFKLPAVKVLEYDWYSAYHQKNFKKATFLYESDAVSVNTSQLQNTCP